VLLDGCGVTEIGGADFRSGSVDVSGQGDALRILRIYRYIRRLFGCRLLCGDIGVDSPRGRCS
jgi:hypothetical protein